MSTNFYFRPADQAQYRDADHIGLYAAGMFMFRVFLANGLTSFAAWQEKLRQPGLVIVDEYNDPVSFAGFKTLAESCLNAPSTQYRNAPHLQVDLVILPKLHRYRDAAGHLFGNYVFS